MAVDWNMLTPVGVTPFDVGEIQRDVRAARKGNRDEAQYNAMLTAGQRMKAGDVKGATGELYAGGLFNEGMQTDKFQMDKDNQARERNARIAFSIKSPADLARVQETFTRLGQPVPAEFASLDSATRHARAFAMSPHETATVENSRRSTDATIADMAARRELERKKFDMTTPEYRSRMWDTYGRGPEDPARPGYIAGIPDKPSPYLTLPDKARLIAPPTPSRPGSFTDVTPERAGGPEVSHEIRGDEHKLRQQFLSQSDEYIKVRDAYGRLQSSAQVESAASDMAIIFNIMKMYDPGSVVRETEFATAQNAAGIPDRVRAQWNRLISGERLAPTQRADFLNVGQRLFTEQNERFKQTRSEFERIAAASGLDPRRVLVDIERRSDGSVPPSGPKPPAPAVAPGVVPPKPEDVKARTLFERAPVGHRIPAPAGIVMPDGTRVPVGTPMEKGADGAYRPVTDDPWSRLKGMRE